MAITPPLTSHRVQAKAAPASGSACRSSRPDSKEASGGCSAIKGKRREAKAKHTKHMSIREHGMEGVCVTGGRGGACDS